MRKRHARHALTPEEQIARYAHVLGAVPASVADKAYAAAFSAMPPGQREDIVDQLRAELPDASVPASVDPDSFALLMRDLLARNTLVRIPGGAMVAAAFVASAPVAAYFRSGAGSLTMDHQPPWVHQLAGHETAPVDGGRTHHRYGISGLASLDNENTGDSRDW